MEQKRDTGRRPFSVLMQLSYTLKLVYHLPLLIKA